MKFIFALVLALVTLGSGLWLIYKPVSSKFFHRSEALVSGLFIGAALFHLLPEATLALKRSSHSFAFTEVGILMIISFSLLFALEKASQYKQLEPASPNFFAGGLVLAALSLHSIIGGLALGLNSQWGDLLIIFAAILAHKATDSFALVINLQRARLKKCTMMIFLVFFTIMTPLGMLWAYYLAHTHLPAALGLWQGYCNALAAGTFLYIGTIEGAGRQLLRAKALDKASIGWLSLGILLMLVLARWS